MSRPTRCRGVTRILAGVLAPGLLAAACGGDSGEAPAGMLWVDGERFAFTVESCLSGEDVNDEDGVAFQLSASGETSREREFVVEARLIDLEAAGLGQTQLISLTYRDDELDGYESLPDLSGAGPTLSVEDGNVAFEGEFTTIRDQEPVGSGELQAECP